jgi:hypothetical protein
MEIQPQVEFKFYQLSTKAHSGILVERHLFETCKVQFFLEKA